MYVVVKARTEKIVAFLTLATPDYEQFSIYIHEVSSVVRRETDDIH